MIVLSNSAAQTIQPGASAVFNLSKLHTGCGEYHREGSGAVRLRAGLYELEFTGNIGGAAATQSSLVIAVDDDPLLETTMTATITDDTDAFNVHSSTVFKNCFGGTAVSVENIGTTPVTVQANPALIVRRVS